MVWTDLNAKVLQEILEELDKENIPWMIMRNYKELPYENNSKDIDIAIPKKMWDKSRKIIYVIAKNNGFARVIYTKFQSILCHTFFKFSGNIIYSFKIDIFGCYEWRGAEYISFESIYKSSRIYNSMHVPNEAMDAVMLFLKPLILGGTIKEKYQQMFETIFEKKKDDVQEIINGILGPKWGLYIWELYERKDYKKLKESYHFIRRQIWKRSFMKAPVHTLYGMFSHYYTECRRRIFTCENNLIAVLGSDGVGKTTFINNYKNLLIEYIPLEKELIKGYHFRPCIFPNIKKLLLGRKYDVKNEKFEDPHRAKPSGKIGSIARVLYYWLDYMIGMPIIFAKGRANNWYLIFDRYFHDFLVDPYRSRININYRCRCFFYKLVKKPFITFVLLAEPKVIYQRKRELGLKEIERQTDEYLKLVNGRDIVKIDASRNSVDMAKKAFMLFVNKKGDKL